MSRCPRILVFAGDSGYYRFSPGGYFAQRLRELGS